MRLHDNGLSFLRVAEEGTIKGERDAPFLMVYISTASAIQHEFDAHRGAVKRPRIIVSIRYAVHERAAVIAAGVLPRCWNSRRFAALVRMVTGIGHTVAGASLKDCTCEPLD